MKATDLRIGNYVNPNCGELEHIMEIECVLPNEVSGCLIDDNYEEWLTHSNQNISIEGIAPVPLTEEWLKDFGFILYDEDRRKFWGLGRSDAGDNIVGYDFIVNQYAGYHVDGCSYEIQYVHQLQNIYHCLTGKELTKTQP